MAVKWLCVCVCIEWGVPGGLSIASAVVMELCTVVRRYLDIEATIAGLLAVSLCSQSHLFHSKVSRSDFNI